MPKLSLTPARAASSSVPRYSRAKIPEKRIRNLRAWHGLQVRYNSSMTLTPDKIFALEKKANELRQIVIEALVEAKSGHTAGPLGMADIFTYLYFHALRHNPKHPDWQERDILVLSNGHICPILYAAMCAAGYGSVEEFKKTLRKFGSRFQGHPHRDYFPQLETSSGPLGSGNG